MPFTDQHGKIWPDAWDTVCPRGEHLGGDNWRFAGTTFYVAAEGVCITAAHCFRQRGVTALTDPAHWIKNPVVIRVLPIDESMPLATWSRVISTSIAGDPPRTCVTPIAPIIDSGFEYQTEQGLKTLSLRDLSKLGIVSIID
jgi:hypothetical protein